MTTISTEDAVRGILALITSPIADTREFENVGTKITELENTASLSGGEHTLADLAAALWRGQPGTIADLGYIDRERARQVLTLLHQLYIGDSAEGATP